MVLIGQAPGRVTVHLTVKASDHSSGQLVGPDGRSVRTLHAQLTVVILPHLSLAAPLVPNPRQLLMSSNSRFHIKPWTDVISNSQVQYEVSSAHPNSSVFCKHEALSVSADGVVRVPPRHQTVDSFGQCYTLVKLTASPKERLSRAALQTSQDRMLSQTTFLEVIVKEPRYLMVTPIPGEYLQTKGLLVGGPYRFLITYHDELGRTFDSVSDDYTLLSMNLNRLDVFDAHMEFSSVLINSRTATPVASMQSAHANGEIPTSFDPHGSVLMIRALPGSTDTKDRQSSWNIPTVLQLNNAQSIPGFSPSFLGLVAGGELDVLRQTSLFVSQWICLPELKVGGIWSSSNPSIFWVDSGNRVLLARRPGKAYLLYSLMPAIGKSPLANISSVDGDYSVKQMTYLVTVNVSPLVSDPKSAIQLVYANKEETAIEKGPVLFPILSSASSSTSLTYGVLRLPIRLVGHDQESKSDHSTCSFKLDGYRRSLASVAPLECNLHMSIADRPPATTHHNGLVPEWLNLLVLWNQNETLHSAIESDSDALALINLFTVSLEPLFPNSPFFSGNSQWQCVVRPNALWGRYSQMLGLVLEPSTRLSVELSSTEEPRENNPTLARLDVIPLPGFQVLVPPALFPASDSATPSHSAAFQFWITEPQSMHRRLLIFVPPITANAMNSPTLGVDRLYARTKNPDVLQVVGTPRSITTLVEVSQVLA
ncbi:unnamed protein product, partial [Echinostoma caproni]|uniref:SHR-BD domain-containing protein n=1 Tax=Echinostoma caproni TaxID=27848 RepID=A0A183BAH9_9TREM